MYCVGAEFVRGGYERMIKSKYWNKTHEEIEYNLEEHHCPYCGHAFMVDISFCKTAPTEDYDDYVKIFCPYCGKFHRMAV